MFRIDWDGPLPTEYINGETAEQEGVIEIPMESAPISAEQFHQLELEENPTGPSATYGIDLYMRTVEFLQRLQFNET